MQFTHYDLGYVERGGLVVLNLDGSAANVRLMDWAHFNHYRAGRDFRFHGGRAQSSPVRLAVPTSGNWHLVVDMMGLVGTVRTTVRIIPSSPLRRLGAALGALT